MSFVDALLSVLNVLLIVGSPMFVMVYLILAGIILFVLFIGTTFASTDTGFYGDVVMHWWEGVLWWILWLILAILVASGILTTGSALSAGNILYW